MAEAEVEKLQRHLDLLRQEYVKLQNKLADVEQKYNVSSAAGGNLSEDSFVARLLKTVADLFDRELYSDLTVKLEGHDIKAHKFVLAARSDTWGVPDLASVQSLDFTEIPYEVGVTMMRWVYTDQADIKADDTFVLQLLKAASKCKLVGLRDRCEKSLMSSVTVKNCIKFYATADEIGANTLREYCSEIISNHWGDFNSGDFVSMTAPLLYKMFKAKTEYPLHTAVRNRREDVVFLYLMEYDAQLPGKLNELDNQGDLPLDLALSTKQESIATELVKHRADVDVTDNDGRCLLHKAVKRDEFSAIFLIKNGAKTNAANHPENETALHIVAAYNPRIANQDVIEGMARVASLLLQYGANPNMQDNTGSTPMHKAIASRNDAVFTLLLDYKQLDLELRNNEDDVVLWLALDNTTGDQKYNDGSFAARLITRGSKPDAINPKTGDTLLHLSCRANNEEAALFLVERNASENHSNLQGETPLHTAARYGLAKLTLQLLHKGANPNAQTRFDVSKPLGRYNIEGTDVVHEATQQTPLHIAIANKHTDVVAVFLEHRANSLHSNNNLQIIPDLNLVDSQEQTVLGLALWMNFHDIAAQLLAGGANINHTMSDGMTLLHQAIMKQGTPSALFLLEHKADLNIKTKENETPLQLSIKRHLPVVVDALCVRGANMNVIDENGNPPLWVALESGQEDVASTLVRHGCDTNAWGRGPGGCQQTLLHRAIDDNNEAVACFLIRSMCDVNSPRRPGPNGEGDEEARDGQGPLHIACQWGLEQVVQALIEMNADVNAKDAEGKTPIHIAVINQHDTLIKLLMSHPLLDLTLRDRSGQTPFAAAMTIKNNKAAQMILDREPGAAEQLDNKGRNFLHIAITNSDIESVLFLISVHANVNSRAQDSSRLSPLHLSVQTGNEMIVRNLLLAGANIGDLTNHKQTCLHIAATHDRSTICSILIENGVDVDAVDVNMNNALHVAVQSGNINCVRVLLIESRINAEHVNLRGQTPMHVLGQYGKENAAAIFELFKECMPAYPVDMPDAEGNTVLLLAYQQGNANLCRAVVRSGACLGTVNKNGISIFNAQVATKQLLFRLLDMLSAEPQWSECETCQECSIKFGIKTRKHHCRHCGRILCSKCSAKMMPIIKYDLNKPVRVCDMCFDVLTLGGVP
ncbi:rabankyrin-5-like isoform X2 [Glandiceps talaboti]